MMLGEGLLIDEHFQVPHGLGSQEGRPQQQVKISDSCTVCNVLFLKLDHWLQ
jgi:hypothetical protein